MARALTAVETLARELGPAAIAAHVEKLMDQAVLPGPLPRFPYASTVATSACQPTHER